MSIYFILESKDRLSIVHDEGADGKKKRDSW